MVRYSLQLTADNDQIALNAVHYSNSRQQSPLFKTKFPQQSQAWLVVAEYKTN
ncbi:hypothetical protein D3C75_1289560 [compost metagenome]